MITTGTTVLHAPAIDPVAFFLGPVAVRWYGLMYLLGAAAFWFLGRWRARDAWRNVQAQWVDDVLFYGVLGAIIGGRLGYVVFYSDWGTLADDPLMPLRIWQGGMSFHGGLIGVFAALWFLARRYGVSVWQLSDFVAPLVPPGLAFGRMGNFINGELWGRVSDAPWAMIFRHADHLPRHPSQLYEASLEGFLLFAFLWWFSARRRRAGEVTAWFAMGYAISRFLVEFVREPDAHIGFIAWGWLTLGHVLTIPVGVLGLCLWLRARRGKGVDQPR